MHSPDILGSGLVAPRLFRLDEYHRLIDVGVLGEDERVELLEGVIVEMAPQGRAHALVVSRLNRFLTGVLGDAYSVRPQLPLSLAGDSEPEPDLAIVTRQEEESAPVHPRSALLVVEVADESLRRDRLLKGRIYARAQVSEYWVVDVAGRAVEVYSEPDPDTGRYRTMRTLGVGETLSSSSLPGLALPVAELFA
ncbi:Uma2 family endonuclease [Archangium violaceum]|uniref:Uma2 family endonuclease n=1 Tax=Archangium violaceum TaxID=83451 RepID=UPI0019522814|nr:Uma2 family endonuclease [Archangium violaceum]QRN97364.1 Uma2 family endonuclease [Archangium violaceum]